MTTIVTRAGKGSPLTHTEVDTNFTNLNTNKLEAGAIALGSAATPSISFTGYPNTGIYSPGAYQVAVATNGVGRLFVDASGNVGVGTGSSSERLRLGFTSTTQSALVFAPTAALNAGNSFISASASASRIGGAAVNGVVINLNEASVNTIGRVTSIVGSVNSGLSLDNRGGIVGVFGSAGLTSSHSTGHGYGVLGSSSDANTNAFGVVATLNSAGAYEGKAALLAVGSATGDVAYFRTFSSEAMRITAAGLVGIGTSAPVNVLELAGNNSAGNGIGNVQGILRVNNNTTAFGSSPTAGIVFATKYRSSPNIPLDGAAIYGGKENTADANKSFFLAFATRAESGNNGNEAMRITSAGLVGIGTTSPGVQLEIAGTASALLRLDSSNANGASIRLRRGGVDKHYLGSAADFLTSGAVDDTAIRTNANIVFGVNATERARIDSSGRLLVGTSSAVAGTVDAASIVGSALTQSTGLRSLSSGGTLDLNLLGTGIVGHLYVSSVLISNATVRTNTVFFITTRQGNATVITSLNSGNGSGGGRAFTITNPSGNIFRFTDTSSSGCAVSMSFVGSITH
jgi:hypothetical protein